MFVFTLQNHVDDSSLLCEVEIAVVESAMAGNARRYCWWKKSQTTTWDVWNPVKNGINYLSTGAGFQPSTVVTSGKGDVSKRPCFLLQTNTDQMRFFRYPQPLSQSVDWSESPSYSNRIDAFTSQIRFFEDGARSLKLTVRPWKRMVGNWIFFWEGLFSGALLNLGRVNSAIFLLEPLSFPPTLLVNECGNGCPPQQELKQISNFQPVVFVTRIYTNINHVSLPLILPLVFPD